MKRINTSVLYSDSLKITTIIQKNDGSAILSSLIYANHTYPVSLEVDIKKRYKGMIGIVFSSIIRSYSLHASFQKSVILPGFLNSYQNRMSNSLKIGWNEPRIGKPMLSTKIYERGYHNVRDNNIHQSIKYWIGSRCYSNSTMCFNGKHLSGDIDNWWIRLDKNSFKTIKNHRTTNRVPFLLSQNTMRGILKMRLCRVKKT